jgi:hypothetical protein
MGEFRRTAPPPSSATMSGENEFRHRTPPPCLRYHECKPSLGLRATTTRCTRRIEAPSRRFRPRPRDAQAASRQAARDRLRYYEWTERAPPPGPAITLRYHEWRWASSAAKLRYHEWGDEFRHQSPPPWLRYHECNPSPGLRATTTRCTRKTEAPSRGSIPRPQDAHLRSKPMPELRATTTRCTFKIEPPSR